MFDRPSMSQHLQFNHKFSFGQIIFHTGMGFHYLIETENLVNVKGYFPIGNRINKILQQVILNYFNKHKIQKLHIFGAFVVWTRSNFSSRPLKINIKIMSLIFFMPIFKALTNRSRALIK